MKRPLLEQLLLGLGLGPGTRIDLLNLAHSRAVNVWPHRLVAAATTLFIAVLGTGMTRQWSDMRNHRPSPGSTLANLRASLVDVQKQIAGEKQKFDPKEAQLLGAQVREANTLITLRAFKPTELLGDLEAVKPFDGRLLGLRRGKDRGGIMLLDFHLKAPTRKTYEEFAVRIGRARRFSNLELRGESTQTGEFDADISMVWTPEGPPEATDQPPGPEKALTRKVPGRAPMPAAAHRTANPAPRPAPPAAAPPPARKPPAQPTLRGRQ